MKRSRVLLTVLLVLAVVASGCGSSAHKTGASGQVPQLQSIDQLRHEFDAHPGVPRLILLISPT